MIFGKVFVSISSTSSRKFYICGRNYKKPSNDIWFWKCNEPKSRRLNRDSFRKESWTTSPLQRQKITAAIYMWSFTNFYLHYNQMFSFKKPHITNRRSHWMEHFLNWLLESRTAALSKYFWIKNTQIFFDLVCVYFPPLSSTSNCPISRPIEMIVPFHEHSLEINNKRHTKKLCCCSDNREHLIQQNTHRDTLM